MWAGRRVGKPGLRARVPARRGGGTGLRLGTLVLGRRTHLMGVLNVTPDSFSDGGRYHDPEAALVHGLAMARHGADIIDIGGESTRPGAEPVSLEEELRRTVPVVAALRKALDARSETAGLPLSIDTRKPTVARATVAAGAVLVNDVGGLRDPELVATVADLSVPVVAMHMQGEPGTMQVAPRYSDVVRDVREWLAGRIAAAEALGLGAGRIIVDPGIGFGKTLEHNLTLLGALEEFRELGGGILVGASRKSFIAHLAQRLMKAKQRAGGTKSKAMSASDSGFNDENDRLGGSTAAAVIAMIQGVDIIRTHDIRATRQALDVAFAILEASGKKTSQ